LASVIILVLCPLLPFLAALLLPFLKFLNKEKKLIYTLGIAVISLLFSLFLVWQGMGSSLTLFRLTDDISIFFRVDGLSTVFIVLVSVLWVGLDIYSRGYITGERFDTRYYVLVFIVMGSLLGLALAGNIVTFFLFFEIMTFSAFPLICHDRSAASIKAATIYIIYSIFGSTMALLGIVLLNSAVDITNFVAGGIPYVRYIESETTVIVAFLLMLFGFGCKAGMYPLHAWLPIAHPVAPAPISAALSALLTKAGIFGILRTVYFLIGFEFMRDTWIHNLWLGVALGTVFIGSMLAVREPVLKKRLAYSSISQISYIMFGLAMLDPLGFEGGVMQLVFHAFAKFILFLCAGAIIHQTALTQVSDLKGIGKKMPVVMCCFTLSSLSLIGIPPMGGFLSKWHLITAAFSADIGVFSWLGPVFLIISALLTAVYLLTIIIEAFFPGADHSSGVIVNQDPGWNMKAPLIILSVLALLQSFFPGQLIENLLSIAYDVIR